MKKYLLLIVALSLMGCERKISRDLEADTHGHVVINGKDCEVVTVDTGSASIRLYFIDCGPGSSSVTYQSGKTQQSVSQYTPPVASSAPACSCPARDATEDLKKIQEIKKDFYK